MGKAAPMMDETKTVALILAQLEPNDGISIEVGPASDANAPMTPEEQLHAVAGELVDAVHCGDVGAVVEALRGAFLLLDSMPHVEGEHVDEELEEGEPEEEGHDVEPVSHEVFERLGGFSEANEYAYGGRGAYRMARGGVARFSKGGRVRAYADGGTVDDEMTDEELEEGVNKGARARSGMGADVDAALQAEADRKRLREIARSQPIDGNASEGGVNKGAKSRSGMDAEAERELALSMAREVQRRMDSEAAERRKVSGREEVGRAMAAEESRYDAELRRRMAEAASSAVNRVRDRSTPGWMQELMTGAAAPGVLPAKTSRSEVAASGNEKARLANESRAAAESIVRRMMQQEEEQKRRGVNSTSRARAFSK